MTYLLAGLLVVSGIALIWAARTIAQLREAGRFRFDTFAEAEAFARAAARDRTRVTKWRPPLDPALDAAVERAKRRAYDQIEQIERRRFDG